MKLKIKLKKIKINQLKDIAITIKTTKQDEAKRN